MIEIDRNMLKNDAVFSKLHHAVKKNHVVSPHTQKTLLDNKDVKDFCVETRHFAKLDGKHPMFIHYDTSSWLQKPNKALVRIDSIGIYDNFMEYEAARVRGLHGGKPADIPNVN